MTLSSTPIITDVYSLTYNSIYIAWDLPDHPALEEGQFIISRSNSPTGPFTPIAQVPLSAFDYTDNDLPVKNSWIDYFYTVTLTTPNGTSTSPVANRVVAKDSFTREMLHQVNLQIKVVQGSPYIIYEPLRWGQRCPVCWDEEAHRRTNPDCEVCYGTGFSGGYFPPQIVWVALINPLNQQYRLTNPKLTTTNTQEMYLPPNPKVYPQTIIRSPSLNMNYRVISVQLITRFGEAVIQQITAEELAHDDISYKLPIPDNYKKELSKFNSRFSEAYLP